MQRGRLSITAALGSDVPSSSKNCASISFTKYRIGYSDIPATRSTTSLIRILIHIKSRYETTLTDCGSQPMMRHHRNAYAALEQSNQWTPAAPTSAKTRRDQNLLTSRAYSRTLCTLTRHF
jgi:hypothetical protein